MAREREIRERESDQGERSGGESKQGSAITWMARSEEDEEDMVGSRGTVSAEGK